MQAPWLTTKINKSGGVRACSKTFMGSLSQRSFTVPLGLNAFESFQTPDKQAQALFAGIIAGIREDQGEQAACFPFWGEMDNKDGNKCFSASVKR